MKFILLFFLVTGMIFSQMNFVYAHKMVIETVETGIIKVVYEDGSFSRRTIVTIYDDQGNELSSGSLDDEGYFFYDPKKVSLVVVNDGIGHRAEWEVGTMVQGKFALNRWFIASIVVFILSGVAWITSLRTNRKKQQRLD